MEIETESYRKIDEDDGDDSDDDDMMMILAVVELLRAQMKQAQNRKRPANSGSRSTNTALCSYCRPPIR